MVAGSVTFTLTSGKTPGPYIAEYHSDDNYVDVTKGGKGYPTRLDFMRFKTVSSISFTADVSRKKTTWSTWTYFNNGPWAVDRFTQLG